MKITFEGETIRDIVRQMDTMLDEVHLLAHAAEDRSAAINKPAPLKPQGVSAEVFHEAARARNEAKEVLQKIADRMPADAVDKPVHKPGKKPRTEKQLANDEKMRIAALERVASKRAAKAQVTAALEAPLPPPPLATAEGVDPVEVVNIRNKTITDLQEAYANGHQQEVFELLSRFGNGAKSFRELPPEAFMPIRQAIDNGALT